LRFQFVGALHSRLRLAFLLQEFLQQQGKQVALRIGSTIPGDAIENISNDQIATEYLRLRTYLLGERGKVKAARAVAVHAVLPQKKDEAILPGLPRELLLRDLEGLGPRRRLSENSDFTVYSAKAEEIPHLLQEIGRLREVTARLGIVLIFDEVVTFPVAYGGAQAYHGVHPDLTTMSKAIGGGLPLAAVRGIDEADEKQALAELARAGAEIVADAASASRLPRG